MQRCQALGRDSFHALEFEREIVLPPRYVEGEARQVAAFGNNQGIARLLNLVEACLYCEALRLNSRTVERDKVEPASGFFLDHEVQAPLFGDEGRNRAVGGEGDLRRRRPGSSCGAGDRRVLGGCCRKGEEKRQRETSERLSGQVAHWICLI